MGAPKLEAKDRRIMKDAKSIDFENIPGGMAKARALRRVVNCFKYVPNCCITCCCCCCNACDTQTTSPGRGPRRIVIDAPEEELKSARPRTARLAFADEPSKSKSEKKDLLTFSAPQLTEVTAFVDITYREESKSGVKYLE